ncbi:efflux RND transporter periplasmic adaptor subunit [Thiohalorhabdus methylotrophus]|uniref:Efflux RND transporter periplasmic adaptor subunit n=1 Tax=Thiohalorhabdus methylotrophus TaxID=3242694 RepID=A0ABV4TU83_9GAMM
MRTIRPNSLLKTALLLAVVLATAGCGSGEAQPKPGERPPPQVGVVELQPRPVERITKLPGRTSPYRVAQVRPQVTGILQKRQFQAGAQVEAGQTLYRIDSKRYRAAVERAKADLAEARASLDTARKQVARFEKLVEKNAVSRQEYDDVRAAYQEQKARVQSAEAALKTARIDLAYTTVDAPITGRVSQSYITEGALVTANQSSALARITQLDPIYVDIQRPATEVLRLKRALQRGELEETNSGKARVRLRLDDGTTYEHAGKLAFSGVTVDQGTGTVTLRAVLPNPDHHLMPGMFVRARLRLGTDHKALLVPQQGVTRNRRGEATALVVNGKDRVAQRKLEVREARGSFWVVEKGLKAGDRVIVSGLQKVKPGARVKPVVAEIPNKPEGAEHG